jgi:hypothetical protein
VRAVIDGVPIWHDVLLSTACAVLAGCPIELFAQRDVVG